MKTSIQNMRLKTFLMLAFFSFLQLIVMAQDNSESSSTTTKSTTTSVGGGQAGNWYSQPWVWIVGAAVFILLLIALLRGSSTSGSTDRVTVTKTVQKDTDV